MAAQLGLPAALAARGLKVETVPGWEKRSAGSFNPKGAVCHWTAGPKGTLKRPSLAICTNGRSDLPGPLCNVYLSRDGVAVVVAAGRANHAGAGSWHGVTGNSSFFGTECEAAGPDDFTPAQRAAYPRVNAAFCDLGGFGADMVCGHSEYATPRGRKSDINGYTMTDMRADVASVLAGQSPTSPLQEDDMYDNAARDELVGRIDMGFARLTNLVNGLEASDTRTRIGIIQYGMNLLLAREDGESIDYDKLAAALAPVLAPMVTEAGTGATADEVANKLAERLAA